MKRTKRTKKHSLPGGILFGLLINAATLLAVAFVFAFIASQTKNPLSVIKLGGIISFYICAALASVIISTIRKERNVVTALLSALSFTVILLCLGLVFSDGGFPLINAVNYIIYCLIAFVLARLCRGFKRRRKI